MEAEAIARLHHPNIVQIYEVGEHDGRPFFSLEFVDGGSLHQRLAGKPRAAREAAQLVETVARAVHAAHQRGVIHRDLKPANVLLTADGVPKVSDFGLAKQLDDDSGQTQSGAIMGTPSYMAPEQATGQTRDLGPPADVYSLGAILYELLTGRPPFRGASTFDTLEQVRRQDAVPPSQFVARLPRDVETICLKCLEKEPGKRYGSAAGLADDLERFRKNEPILARPVGRAERLWRWCYRNPVYAGLSATVVLVLLAGTLVSGYFALEAGRAQDAEDAAELADRQKRRADDKADEADKNARQANWRAYVSDMQRIGHEWEFGRVSRMRTLLDSHLPARAGGEDLRGMEWHFWDHLCRGEVCTFRGHDSGVAGVAFDPDGKRVVSVGVEIIEKHDPSLHIWEADTGKLIRSLPGETCVALSADGRWLAALSEKHDPPPEIALWDAITGRQTFTLKGHGASAIYALVFSPDNKLLASCGGDWTTRLWDVASGKEVRTLRGHTLRARCVAFRCDGAELASGSDDGTVRLWDVVSGRCKRVISAVPSGVVWTVAYSPDGKSLAAGGDEPHSQDLGDRHRPRTAHAEGAYCDGLLRGLQPGRPAAGVGRLRPDRARLGPGQR